MARETKNDYLINDAIVELKLLSLKNGLSPYSKGKAVYQKVGKVLLL